MPEPSEDIWGSTISDIISNSEKNDYYSELSELLDYWGIDVDNNRHNYTNLESSFGNIIINNISFEDFRKELFKFELKDKKLLTIQIEGRKPEVLNVLYIDDWNKFLAHIANYYPTIRENSSLQTLESWAKDFPMIRYILNSNNRCLPEFDYYGTPQLPKVISCVIS
jgi:hypothetical protein